MRSKNKRNIVCLLVLPLLISMALPSVHLSASAKTQTTPQKVTKPKTGTTKATMNKKAKGEIVYIDDGYNSLELNDYVDNLNKKAEYSIIANDPDMCQIEEMDKPGYYNGYRLLGLIEGDSSLTITETYLGKSRVIGDIEVNISTKPESIVINNKYKEAKKNENGELYFSVTEGANGDINTLFDVTPSLLKLHYYSSNERVLSIDDKTGIFKAGIPGETKITISGWTVDLNIMATVISKNNLPGIFVSSEKYIAAVNALHPEAITQDNLLDSYQQLIDTYKIIGRQWPEDYDGVDESHLYTFIGSMGENFWAIPNIRNMEKFRKTLTNNLYEFAWNLDKERKIEKISVIDTKTLEIELNIPFTKEERAHESLRGSMFDVIESFEIYNQTRTVKIDGDYTRVVDDKIQVSLKKPLPNGTYIIEIPSYTFQTITYKFTKNGNRIMEYKK